MHTFSQVGCSDVSEVEVSMQTPSTNSYHHATVTINSQLTPNCILKSESTPADAGDLDYAVNARQQVVGMGLPGSTVGVQGMVQRFITLKGIWAKIRVRVLISRVKCQNFLIAPCRVSVVCQQAALFSSVMCKA